MARFREYRERLLTARDADQVARILLEATSNLAPEELRALPDECREALAERGADIHTVAVTLLHCDLRHRGERDIGEVIRQTAELYAWASVRLSQLEHMRPTTAD